MIWKVTKPLRPLFFCSLIALYFHISNMTNETPGANHTFGVKIEKQFKGFEAYNGSDMTVTAADAVTSQAFN